MDHSLHAWKSG